MVGAAVVFAAAGIGALASPCPMASLAQSTNTASVAQRTSLDRRESSRELNNVLEAYHIAWRALENRQCPPSSQYKPNKLAPRTSSANRATERSPRLIPAWLGSDWR